MNLIHGDCLVELKKLGDKSVDFVYLDLPYGQTACAWDKKVDLPALWTELKRIAKTDRTPFFFSCTTKFGYELMASNLKYFRWDLVWEKNRAAGFLNAYRLPMRKHEMIYCFSKKCPEYDVSSHKNFVVRKDTGAHATKLYSNLSGPKTGTTKTHTDPLPTSVLPPQEDHELIYCFAKKTPEYDVSSHDEYTERPESGKNKLGLYSEDPQSKGTTTKTHKVPLPTSIIPPQEDHELVYCFAKKSPDYDVSSHNEFIVDNTTYQELKSADIYGKGKRNTPLLVGDSGTGGKRHKEPLPTSIMPPQEDHELVYCFAKKTPAYDVSSHKEYSEATNAVERPMETYAGLKVNNKVKAKSHKEPLPTSIMPEQDDVPSSWCAYKLDLKTGHRTAKPVKLMEFLLKYWSKPGDVVLDPTMGSGSMGIACKNMGRNFIGIEMNDDIYELAKKRVGD